MTDRPTPETDDVAWLSNLLQYETVDANFARRLERERNEAREDLKVTQEAWVQVKTERIEALRERDEARDAAEKAKAFKRAMKEDNAKLRRDLDKAQRDADTFLENFGKTQERAINAERELDELNKRLIEVCQYGVVCTIEREDLRKELDEARDDARVLLKEIFNLTQIGDPHPADLPMKALQAIAEMIDEHLKEVCK